MTERRGLYRSPAGIPGICDGNRKLGGPSSFISQTRPRVAGCLTSSWGLFSTPGVVQCNEACWASSATLVELSPFGEGA